jgi:hypothetical protein
MSILAQIGTKIGSEIKNLGIRMSSAETAIVNLGGQQPPPTGNFSIAPVTWTNLTEINLSPIIGDVVVVTKIWTNGGTSVVGESLTIEKLPSSTNNFQYKFLNTSSVVIWATEAIYSSSVFYGVASVGSVQVNGNGGLEKISGSNGYNAGASSTNFIEGNSNGYVQFQIAHATNSVKIGLVYADSDFKVDDPYLVNIGGGNVDVYTPFIDNKTTCVNGDWFRIRHYSSTNEIHFQKRQIIYSPLPNFALPTSPNNGHSTHYNYAEEDRPLAVSLVTMTLANGHEIIEGQPFKIETLSFSVSNEVSAKLLKLDGTSIGWVGNRSAKWEVAEEIGQDYRTFYTHPVLTNGNDLYIDTSFYAVGSRLNDVLLAR